MNFIVLGFLTGLSLILAIGAQNIFVIEQGLKKQHVFLVSIVCSISDFILIFLGIFLFHYFNQFFNKTTETILNVLLLLFLFHFIYKKIRDFKDINKLNINESYIKEAAINVFLKTLGFTYLNPHVYSDTVFFLGNFSKNFLLIEKLYFGIGATISSFIFFFTIGYLSKFLSKYFKNQKTWKIINFFIIGFMVFLIFYILKGIF
jgi:L-lysine exporter family protein LysE/ArgO|tara:strand:+ start:3833 stop:4444 length:612 start_codon:yes stop_codon:yes gene_type:complete